MELYKKPVLTIVEMEKLDVLTESTTIPDPDPIEKGEEDLG